MLNRPALLAAVLAAALQAQSPGAVVALEAGAVRIPPLPASVAAARQGYSRARKDLEAAFREAERYLAACNRELAAMGDPGTRFTLPPNVKWVEVMAVDHMEYGAHTEFGKLATVYADTQAAILAEGWKPLTGHLDAGAAALLDLDRTAPPTSDPSLKALRLMARINFMERFRSTVWFCQVVWAHMASKKVLSIQQM